MSMALKMVAAYLDSKGLKYDISEERRAIKVGFRVENKGSIDVLVIFDKGDTSVALRSFDYCKVPESKLAKMYETCSKINKDYRWVRFYVNESDQTVTIADDAVIQLDSCSEEIWELICRMVQIGDEVYPTFMKALWT